ncbi:MAG: hypothetical protein NTX50_11350 [Candidatus Sumerlaeota bacterium]|nr:hypothetical protein [Candidatus Sumerlaeota bacterium]
MKTKIKKIKESQALLDVWKLKENAYKKVAHLEIGAAIEKRLRDSIETAKKLNMLAVPK